MREITFFEDETGRKEGQSWGKWEYRHWRAVNATPVPVNRFAATGNVCLWHLFALSVTQANLWL